MTPRRGVTARLPVDGHARPSVLDQSGLVVTHIDEKGINSAVYDFTKLPVSSVMQRSWAVLFARQAEIGGAWRSIVSSREVFTILGTFARFLSSRDPQPLDVDEISSSIWNEWRVSRAATPMGEKQIRKVAAFLRLDSRLPDPTREATLRRIPRVAATETAYSDDEFDAIKAAAMQHFRRAWQRVSDNRAYLAAWRNGEHENDPNGWLLGSLLDHLARTGHVPRYRRESDGKFYIEAHHRQVLGGNSAEHHWQRLYLTNAEAVSVAVLMVIAFGWNSTSIAEMTKPESLPDPDPEAPVSYRVEIEKRRRHRPHRFETRNLADWGPNSPARLLTRTIEATASARDLLAACGRPTDRLLVWHVSKDFGADDPGDLFRFGFDDVTIRQWRAVTGTPDLSLRRLRRTVTVRHRRTPTQHSQGTHDSVYVLRDPATHEHAALAITDGVEGAIASAKAIVRARISRNDADTAAGEDTVTASCSDYRHSPFSAHGSPCRASFLLCLACANAVITPRHLPKLAFLLQAFDELRAVLPSDVWNHDWREHHARLTQLRVTAFTATEWSDAFAAITAEDRATINDLLRKGFDS